MPLSASVARRSGGVCGVGWAARCGLAVGVFGAARARTAFGSFGPDPAPVSPQPPSLWRVVRLRRGLFSGRRSLRRRSASSALKYRHFRRFLAHPVKKGTGRSAALLLAPRACGLPPIGGPRSTLSRGPCRAGSLTGAVRLSNGNAGVPRRAQRGRKPRVEQKGKSSLDLDFQYEYGPRKRGPSILSERRAPFRREVSEKLPQG